MHAHRLTRSPYQTPHLAGASAPGWSTLTGGSEHVGPPRTPRHDCGSAPSDTLDYCFAYARRQEGGCFNDAEPAERSLAIARGASDARASSTSMPLRFLFLMLCASCTNALMLVQQPLPTAPAAVLSRAASIRMTDNPFAALGKIPAPALIAAGGGAVMVAAVSCPPRTPQQPMPTHASSAGVHANTRVHRWRCAGGGCLVDGRPSGCPAVGSHSARLAQARRCFARGGLISQGGLISRICDSSGCRIPFCFLRRMRAY